MDADATQMEAGVGKNGDPEETVLRSPALYGGEVRVVPKRSRSKKRFRGATVKPVVWGHARWVLETLPVWVPRTYLRAAIGVGQGAAPLPFNQLREACEYAAILSCHAGHDLKSRGIYRRFLDQVRVVLEMGLRIRREGLDPVLPMMRMGPGGEETLRAAAQQYGGVILAVPHNPGAIMSAPAVARAGRMLLISKNPASVERTRMALGAYEALRAQVLMVRSGSPTRLMRTCLRELKKGTTVVATLDRPDRSEGRVVLPMFGQPVGLAPWAARIAVRAKVPLVPGFIRTDRRGVTVETDEAQVHTDPIEAMRHYVGYFERSILADPGSWSFLADKRWRWILRDASRAVGGG